MQVGESTAALTTVYAISLAGEALERFLRRQNKTQTDMNSFRVPNSGSFIRPSAKLSFGSSFLQAIRAKYVADIEEPTIDALGKSESRQYTRRNLADIEVEAPNMAGVIQRASQLHKLREVGLGGWKREADPEGDTLEPESYAEVARAFESKIGEQEGDIQKTCKSIRGLDLSRSLLPSWLELSKITCELHLLESLHLHFNRFEELSPTTMPVSNAFGRLRDLRINGTHVSWHDILDLSSSFPILESLQLGSNNIARLDGAQSSARLAKLRSLNLEGNKLDSWDDVWSSLKICPSLERLILSFNKIGAITKVKRDDEHPKVQHISLWNNPLSSWSDLDTLDDCFGGLKSLVLGGDDCLLTKDIPTQDIRSIAIARLAHLQSFNNAPIRAIERRDAELFYLSQVAKSGSSSEGGRDKEHPRWTPLSQIHGAPIVESTRTKESNGTLRSKLLLVKVHLSNEPPFSDPPYMLPPTQQAEVSLLTTTPLRLLVGKLARSFSLKKGGRSIQSIWALLSPYMDPNQATAEALRRELRPDENPSDEKIVYQMDIFERDLQGYNFSLGDEIVLVVDQQQP